MILWETKTGCRPETSVQIRMRDIDRSQGFPWIVYPSSDIGNVTFADEECGEYMAIYWRQRLAGDDPELPIFTQEYSSKEPIDTQTYKHAVSQLMRHAKERGMIRPEIRHYELRQIFRKDFDRVRSMTNLDDMREEYCATVGRKIIGFFGSSQTQTQFSETQKNQMRMFLLGMKENLRDEYYRMLRAEILSGGPDTLARTVFYELESKR